MNEMKYKKLAQMYGSDYATYRKRTDRKEKIGAWKTIIFAICLLVIPLIFIFAKPSLEQVIVLLKFLFPLVVIWGVVALFFGDKR